MLLSVAPHPVNLRQPAKLEPGKRLALIGAQNKKPPAVVKTTGSLGATTAVIQGGVGPTAPGPITTIQGPDFDSVSTTTGFYQIPANSSAAPGPGHVVNLVSSMIQWSTKSGTNLNSQRLGSDNLGSTTGSFFESLNPTTRTFDAKVVYDTYGSRFVVLALEKTDVADGDATNTSRVLLAVSQDNDPTHGWYFTAINSKLTVNTRSTWLNYPGLAVGASAIFVTGNMTAFGDDATQPRVFQGSRLLIVNKTGFYSGAAPASATFYDPSTAAGLPVQAFTLQPALMYGAAPGATGTFLVSSGYVSGATDFLSVIRVDNPLGSPTFVNQFISLGDIHNGAVAFPSAVPQKNTALTVNGGDLRMYSAVWRNNALWAVNDINPTATYDAANAGQLTAHWYKINTITPASLSLSDQGNVGGEDIGADTRTFYPAIAVDTSGNVGIGFSASGPNVFPSAAYTGRAAADPASTVRASVVYAAGVDYYYRPFGGSSNRWGDYSSIAIDPAGSTFWTFNQYALARGTPIPLAPGEDGRWGTRLAAFTYAITGTISGQMFADNLSNGVLDGSDVGLVGQTVYLDVDNNGTFNAGDIPANTTAGGAFIFNSVIPGAYTLREIVPLNFVQSGPPGNSYNLLLSPGGTMAGFSFTNFPLAFSDVGINANVIVQLNGAGTHLQILFGASIDYQAPLTLPPSLSFSLGAGDDTLTISGANGNPIPTGGISFDGGSESSADALTVAGTLGADTFSVSSGAVTFGGRTITHTSAEKLFIEPRAGSDALTVNSGTVRISAQSPGAGLLTRQFSNLIIDSGATVIVGATAAQTDRTSLVAALLSITGTGKIELSNNEMTVTAAASVVRAQIITGQIASSSAGGSLGYADIGGGATRVRFTLRGDTNLDATVDVADLGNLASAYGLATGASWSQGDYDYDGSVGVNDLGDIATNYGLTLL